MTLSVFIFSNLVALLTGELWQLQLLLVHVHSTKNFYVSPHQYAMHHKVYHFHNTHKRVAFDHTRYSNPQAPRY